MSKYETEKWLIYIRKGFCQKYIEKITKETII